MRDSLLEAISKASGIDEIIIVTHNIDFLFLQAFVFEKLKSRGSLKLTVFADAGCALESYAAQAELLEGLGVRYRVVPVAMQPGFRFHPKALLLAGRKSAQLFIGSGNLTYGGWIDNAEVWTRLEASTEGITPFKAFVDFLRECVTDLPLADRLGEDLARALALAALSANPNVPFREAIVVGRAGNGQPMLEAIRNAAKVQPGGELFVCSPYYDHDGEALRALQEAFAPARTNVLFHPLGSTFSRQTLARNSGVEVHSIAVQRVNDKGVVRDAFCHAKFYAIVQGDEAVVFSGSANCSAAALLVAGARGNAELLVARRMPAAEFRAEWLGELPQAEFEAPIPELPPAADAVDREPLLRIVGARVEDGRLHIAYTPADTPVAACETNQGILQVGELGANGAIEVAAPTLLRWVKLRGVSPDKDSATCWVDIEEKLRFSPRRNPVVDELRKKVRPGAWDRAAWEDVLNVFLKHASERFADSGRHRPGREMNPKRGVLPGDLFAAAYSIPHVRHANADGLVTLLATERSIQVLLEGWFAIPADPAEDDPQKDEDADDPPGSEEPSTENDEAVDRPTKFNKQKKSKAASNGSRKEDSASDSKRIRKVLGKLRDTLRSEAFYLQRSASFVSADLQLASILLATGRREGWITPQEMADLTAEIWGAMFLQHDTTHGGWLAIRERADPQYVSELLSPSLSAALLGWAFRAQDCGGTLATRLQLIAALAAARHPKVWWGGTPGEVAQELSLYLEATRRREQQTEADIVRAEQLWQEMMVFGEALAALQREISQEDWRVLRDNLESRFLVAGDLLWQNRAGWCINLATAKREDKTPLRVLWLNDPLNRSDIVAGSAVPLRCVLEERWITRDQMQTEVLGTLNAIVRKTQEAFKEIDSWHGPP
ncbi:MULTISPECIES: hypothetical protein [unclassified Acidovorax]|uniref:hypothetical protein n=1 Tax=Acidovorax TaxID=12916 RepID=UPI000C1944A3|nr:MULTISPECIES: hypothetical protein [unclassified Acidovorax]PIF20240.1 hypothetical protein CLU87_4222 [Acidovorax sp. 59]PKW00736.1 hypothetical protein CLU89_0340 [Acidovorax sp. 30]